MGWSTPVLGYSYFGGLVNLAEILASQGWAVICPQVGPVSSNWERACEIYAQLSHGSMDGTTYDIVVDYGIALPGTNVFYSYPPPFRRQATCYNLDPNWRWGPDSPVHFIAHSQGGNTCRYLIHVLERGWSAEGSGYFKEPKKKWVKSLTTLATPHNGSSVIKVLEDLGQAEDILLDKIISASSFLHPISRTFDFCLDHRGISPPTEPGMELLTYVARLEAPDGALTKWRASTYTGFYDNSIVGVIGDLNRIIGPPSPNVYYFTLSFAATLPLPKLSLELDDMFSLPHTLESVVGSLQTALSEWKKKIDIFPSGNFVGGLKGRLFSSPSSSPTIPTSTSTPPFPLTPNPTPLSPVDNSTASPNTLNLALTMLKQIFGESLQDIATWATSRINKRLPPSTPHLPVVGSTVPRVDLFPGFLIVAYPMGSFELSAVEKELIESVGGTTKNEDWRKHDGIVPTCSMSGPWGAGNRVVKVDDVIRGVVGGEVETIGKKGEKALKGCWVDLGKCEWMDHADCIGTCFNPATVKEVVGLYVRISKLLEVLPVD